MARGNTLGRVQGQQPGPRKDIDPEGANPQVQPETPQELSYLDALQMVLDLAGLFPAFGNAADLINAAISAVRGDWFDAALSLAGALPAAGQAVTVGKVIERSDQYLDALRVVETKILPLLPGWLRRDMEELVGKLRKELEDLIQIYKPDTPMPKPRGDIPEAPPSPKPDGDSQVRARSKQKRPDESKGQFGERRTDEELQDKGYEKVSQDKHPYANGIDSVWKNPNPPPDYVIVESKYGTSRLGNTLDGKQMSDSWINGSTTGRDRLAGAVGKQTAFEIRNAATVDKVLAQINEAGDVVFSKLDSKGNVLNSWP